MARHWLNYKDVQTSPYDCEVVSCLNAYYYLTGKSLYKDPVEYDALLSEYGRNKPVTANDRPPISKLYRRLGMRVIKKVSVFNIMKADVAFPVIFTIKDGIRSNTLLHSICIVDYNKKVDAFRIPNFSWRTNSLGWILREDFIKYLPYWPDCDCSNIQYSTVGTRKKIFNGGDYGMVIGLCK